MVDHAPLNGSAHPPLQDLGAAELEELEWGEGLRLVQRGLAGSQGFLWDEAVRKISILLSSPAAFEGEHFLQVGPCLSRLLLETPGHGSAQAHQKSADSGTC